MKLKLLRLVLMLLLQVVERCIAGDIGNTVVRASCECDSTGIKVNFDTEKPFVGRIYARGFPDDPRCGKSFSDTLDTRISVVIPNGQCNVQSTPTESSVVMAISFHATFLTTMDRQFRCMCRSEKGILSDKLHGPQLQTNHLEVSVLPTTELLDTMPTPTCDYSIHSDSSSGPLVVHAKVGDKVWHTWKCADANVGVFVKNCMATNSDGREVELLDEHGCAIDNTVLPDLTYSPDLSMASVETWAFRFSDSSLLNFMCMIETCRKKYGECTGLTPPVCGRGKRSVNHEIDKRYADGDTDNNVYHVGRTIDVLSLDYDDPEDASSFNQTLVNRRHINNARFNVCLDVGSFVSVGLISFTLFIITIVSTVKLLR